MATIKAKRTPKTSKKPKSIGPKFFAILLIFVLSIFALFGNLFTLKFVRDEMKISFDFELRTSVDVLVDNINTLHKTDSSDISRSLALQMVDSASWNDGRRSFWAHDGSEDATTLAGEAGTFFSDYSTYSKETDFGFTVAASYDKAYFDEYAYPETTDFIRISTAVILALAIFALGTCTIAFHRTGTKN